MIHKVLNPIRWLKEYVRLPAAAKAAARKDHSLGLGADPGIVVATEAAYEWLCAAQDNSTSRDGGVARHYSLLSGWSPSYPETTGYIIPTVLNWAREREDAVARERGRRMLDWLVSIQLPEGGFQGGMIGQTPVVPVTFNTGQILIGLASGVAEFGEVYRPAMRKAGDWLVATQDPDGGWRQHATPFAAAGEKAYETHVSWGIFEAARLDPDRHYGEAAVRNVRWALGKQLDNGWVADCCLTDPAQPLTHTIGYVLRGVIEAYRFSNDEYFLDAALKTANGLIRSIRDDGSLPGRLDAEWKGVVDWVCLTGNVQIAHCWLLLYQITGDTRFRDAGFAANLYVRRTMDVDGPAALRGGIKGSFPVSGDYGRFEYLNWACKFFIDSNLLEQSIRQGASQTAASSRSSNSYSGSQ